jgi:hypothetical protein
MEDDSPIDFSKIVKDEDIAGEGPLIKFDIP